VTEPTPLLRLPDRRLFSSPTGAIAVRIGIAIGIVLVNWLIVILEAGSYTDNYDGHVSVVDALYYTTVTLTTTGYGDITPVTTGARLVNALVVTPMRLLFVVLLVGTTLKALTRQSREEFRTARWRRRMKDHVIVLGFGTKGRNAARAMVLLGTPRDQIVVIDTQHASISAATEAGYGAIQGSAVNADALQRAILDRARAVIVAVDRDDTAVLATLTVRRLNPAVTVIASAREEQNAELLRQSGASSVVVSSETTGRLLGLASDSPRTVDVFEDLLSFGHGLDLAQRPTTTEEVGRDPGTLTVPVLAVVRGGTLLPYNDSRCSPLQTGDSLIYAAAQS
jgi:voltage-gated potassium channel